MNINYEKMWEELIANAKEQIVTIPEGAKTKTMFRNEIGMSEYQAEMFLKQAVKDGKLKMMKYKNCYYYYP